MTTTPTLRPPTDRRRPTHEAETDRHALWLWILAVIALVATGIAIAYATGFLGGTEPIADTPTDEVPVDEPADDVPADEPAPADEAPADEPAGDAPGTDPADAPGTVRYDEEPRANWDVTGVATDDVLNVRDAPGTEGAIIATLAHDQAELESTGRIADVGDQLWREVVVPGDGVGWVNAAYLTETAPPATVRYDEEPRANWDVTGVATDDVLNVRDAPGTEGAIIATLAHDQAELESTGRIADVGDQLWREVVVPGDGVGWVSARYLVETT
jgi:hypothetical protein